MRRRALFVALIACCLAMSCEGAFRCDPSPSWTIGPGAPRDAATPSCTEENCPVWAMAAGARHVCAVVGTEGELVCWGANDAGQIAFGRPGEPRAPYATGQHTQIGPLVAGAPPIAAGPLSTCAVAGSVSGNQIVCWGYPFGAPTALPREFQRALVVGLEDVCFVSPDDPDRTQCLSGLSGREIALAGPNSLVLEPDVPARLRFAVPGVGRLADQTYAERELDLGYQAVIGLTLRWGQLRTLHGCGFSIRELGRTSCFGRGERGQLGPGYVATDPELGSLPTRNDVVPALSSCMGGHLGIHPELGGVVLDGPQGGHTCWSRGEGDVRCMGAGDRGQLGNADVVDVSEAAVVQGLPAGERFSVVCGGEFTCAWSRTGVYCWGDNREGQLGLPLDVDRSNVPVRVDLAAVFAR